MQLTRLCMSPARFPDSAKAGAVTLWATRQGRPVHAKVWLGLPMYLSAETFLMPGVVLLKHLGGS